MLSWIFPPSPYNSANLPAQFKDLPEHDALIYVVWLKDEADVDACCASLLSKLEKMAASINAKAIKLWAKQPGYNGSMFSSKPRSDSSKIAIVISLIEPKGSLSELEACLEQSATFYAKYHAKNSVPLSLKTALEGAASNNTSSQGLVSMSFFQAKAGLSDESFKEYWFSSHTPFALDIHPLSQYERNRVIKSEDDSAPNFMGIVPLSVSSKDDLSMQRFFSANQKSPTFNSLRILSDVNMFLDLGNIETIAMREHVL